MTTLNHLFCTLTLLLFLNYALLPIESRQHRERDRKNRHRTEPSSLASQHHIIESKVMPINLCSKGRDMKLVCHCSPNNENVENIRANKAECWIFRNDLTITDPDWTAFHTQSSLESLVFSVHGTGNLSFIPTSVIQPLRHLKKLTIEFASIKNIHGFAFGNFTRIHNISLPNNQIEVIDAYAFANHMELKDLSLFRNQITEVDSFAFINLPELSRLNLERNQIEVLHEETFDNLDKLTELHLGHNNINMLIREVFKGLVGLEILKADNNKVRYLGDCLFSEMWKLRELDLGHNAIESIAPLAFEGLNKLERLNLEHNQLRSLEHGLLSPTPSLTYLNLMKNSLETVTLGTIQPMMSNLINHTSTIWIKDNQFICDCRIAWIFDLANRTKNFQLKYLLENVECMIRTKNPQVKARVVIDDASRQQGVTEEFNYYDDDSYDPNKVIKLFDIHQRDLPCPQEYREQFEHPATREYISFNFGWLSGSASDIKNTRGILILALMSQFLCTFAAFLR